MSEPIPIGTGAHYGDFKGRISIDEADGGRNLLAMLARKVNVQKGYWPVGFKVWASGKGRLAPGATDRNHSLHLIVYAVDGEVASGADELRKYAKDHDYVPVFPFSERIEPAELLELFASAVKTAGVVLTTRIIGDTPIMELHDN